MTKPPAPRLPSFAERVANVERELKDAIEDPDWVYSEPEDITALLICIREQKAALAECVEQYTRPVHTSSVIFAQDRATERARAVLAKWRLK